MSLLNDALKRVKRDPPQPPGALRETADYPLRPVDYEKRSHRLPLFFLFAGVFVLLLASGLFFFKWVGGQHRPHPGGGPLAAPEGPAQSAPNPRAPVIPAISSNEQISRPIAGTAPGVSALPAGTNQGFPVVKLQGIYYRTVRPSALINGETVEEGEFISEVLVKKIDRRTVTLQWGDQVKVLTLRR